MRADHERNAIPRCEENLAASLREEPVDDVERVVV
jgi:hypothetical protein